MSYLQKITIQGIRSFDPENVQALEFFSPLTVILGVNGAGKTTIIESLRFATTGEYPPNSNRGKSFVHDAKYTNSTAIHAQVKLEFYDIGRVRSVLTRSLQTTVRRQQGNLTTTLKKLNSVLKRNNQDMDSRCAVVDTEMLSLMGVSKAVLTNVIFCHQEDSFWPLSEGKVLKEKFDEIFGSMGFVKALEKIRKVRKEEMINEKVLKAEVDGVKFKKTEGDRMRKSLEDLNHRLREHKETINACRLDLQKVESELKVIVDKEGSVQEIQDAISSLRGTIEEKQKMLEEAKKTINHIYKGTQEELKREIKDFDSNVCDLKEKKKSLEEESKSIAEKYDATNHEQNKVSIEIGKLEVKQKQHLDMIEERNRLVVDISKNIGFETTSKMDDNEVKRVETAINSYISGIESQLDKLVKERETQTNEMQSDLQKLKMQKYNGEHKVASNGNEIEKLEEELQQVIQHIKRVDSSNEKFEEINSDIKALKDQLTQLEKVDVRALKADLKGKEIEKTQVKQDISTFEDDIKKLNSERDQRQKMEIFMKDKQKKEEKVNEIKSTHAELMKKLGITNDFGRILDNYLRALENKVDKQFAPKLADKTLDLSRLETKMESNVEELAKVKKQIEEKQKKVMNVCGDESFDNFFCKIDNELKVLRENYASIDSSRTFYRKQIQIINTTDCCPCCEREVKSDWKNKKGEKLDKTEIIKRLQRNVNDIPTERESIQKSIDDKSEIYGKLCSLTQIPNEIEQLRKKIPCLEDEMKEDKRKFELLKLDIEKSRSELQEKKLEIDKLRNVLQEASLYDTYMTQINSIEFQIKRINLFSDDTRSVDDLESELNNKKSRYDQLENDIKKLQTNIQSHETKSSKIELSVSSAENEKLILERDQKEKVSIVMKKEDLEHKIDDLKSETDTAKASLIELKPKIERLERERKDLEEKFKIEENELKDKLNVTKDKLRELHSISKKVKELASDDHFAQIKNLRKQLDTIKDELTKVETSKRSIADQLEQASSRISSAEVRKRDLLDSLKIMDYKEQIEEKKKLLVEKQNELGFDDISILKQKKNSLEKERRSFESKIDISHGKQIPIAQQIDEIEKTLKKAEFKSANKLYKQKVIEWATTVVGGEDLNKYYKALDYAIGNFHQRKMQEINKLIEGFWKQAYRGSDIDYIKIVSDEEEQRSADKRRNYNYRVVKVENGVEVDMRGSCSAGQKVMASLVIRLALAEIFCANCGILALDEPTTNLDKDNIKSFANAISDIIKYRSQIKNSRFQMIIITHDEEFLNCLNDETGQYYYKVYKNIASKNYSRIVRKSINHHPDDDDEDVDGDE